ncbi:MAG TPA: hypothetical protein VN256_21790 [Pyrinomonadaceae bacterium]|nr:hypothetical protein [Pyrinomonadaceae bacterium]
MHWLLIMGYRNEALYEAVKKYVIAATTFIVDKMEDDDPAADANGRNFFFARFSLGSELSTMPEYRHCLEALLADPKIMGQLDVLVGTSSRLSRAPTAEGLMTSLLDLSMAPGGRKFDPEYFEREYAVFEEAFNGDYVLYDVVAPLEGLLAHGSVNLSRDIEISPFTNDDIKPYYTYNDTLVHHESMGKPVAVRTKFRLPKVVKSDSEQSLEGLDTETIEKIHAERLRRDEADRAEQARLNERVEEVVNALRIFGAESVFHVGIIHRASRWFGNDNVFPNPVQVAVRFTTGTEEGWLTSFAQFWDGLQSDRVRGINFLGLAMRRIGYAHERHRIEDKLIDLLIAAEALFLNDSGNETYRGELQYRLAQRAGFFLGGDPQMREKIYHHMKDAYKLRSQIVHGGKIRPLRRDDGSSVDMEEFVDSTRVYLRLSLHKMVSLVMQSPPGKLIDWDELIFGTAAQG